MPHDLQELAFHFVLPALTLHLLGNPKYLFNRSRYHAFIVVGLETLEKGVVIYCAKELTLPPSIVKDYDKSVKTSITILLASPFRCLFDHMQRCKHCSHQCNFVLVARPPQRHLIE